MEKIDEVSEKSISVGVEEGFITKSEQTAPQVSLPQVILVSSGNDNSVLLGEIKTEISYIKERLTKIESTLDDVAQRLEGIESLFNALENIPKIGGLLKKVRLARIKG